MGAFLWTEDVLIVVLIESLSDGVLETIKKYMLLSRMLKTMKNVWKKAGKNR